MVAIAVDRYLCICHPFVRALTVRRAWITSCVLCLFSSAIGVIVALMYNVDATTKQPPSTASTDSRLPVHDRHVDATNNSFWPTSTVSSSWPAASRIVNEPVSQSSHALLCNSDLKLDVDFVAEAGFTASRGHDNVSLRLINNCEPQTADAMVVYEKGVCHPSDKLLSAEFLWYFQKIYNGLFLVCLIVVIFLYALIYRSVVSRRSRRERQKSSSLAFVTSTNRVVGGQQLHMLKVCEAESPSVCDVEEDRTKSRTEQLTVTNATHHHPQRRSVDSRSEITTFIGTRNHSVQLESTGRHRRENRKCSAPGLPTSLRERNRIRVASLKTAAMLFVVTVVFVATFLPAFLMTVNLVPYRMIIFYMYFANNVANPFIYSFMNQNFRENLQRLFCRKTHLGTAY